jgi:hypothetical protein
MNTTDVRPFSNGSEADFWEARNCDRCTLAVDPSDFTKVITCPMQDAICLGRILGTVPADLATEYGATVRGEYCRMPRQCAKLELVPRCEWLSWKGTRRQRRCGLAMSEEVTTDDGIRRAVCPKHFKEFNRAGPTP